MNRAPTSALHRTRDLLTVLLALAGVACGGGGDGTGGPEVRGLSAGAARYGDTLVFTVQGTALDADLALASTACSDLTRSTTAPLASTATTAYYTCRAKNTGDHTVTATRASTGQSLATQALNVPLPQVTLAIDAGSGSAATGELVITLRPDKTPVTVDNFLAYVQSGFYDGTVFHRVVKGFVVQGGGFLPSGAAKTPTLAPIALEVGKGLSNVQWSVAMARTSQPNSATSQFFVNTVDNLALDPSASSDGYAVFGSVTGNTALVAALENVPCTTTSPGFCVPNTTVVITSARQTR